MEGEAAASRELDLGGRRAMGRTTIGAHGAQTRLGGPRPQPVAKLGLRRCCSASGASINGAGPSSGKSGRG